MNAPQKSSTKTRYYLYLLRGVGAFVITLILKTLTNVRVIATSEDEDLLRGQVPKIFFYAVAIIAVYLIYGTVTYLFTLYDGESAGRFYVSRRGKVRFLSEVGLIVRSPEFLLETGSFLLLSLIGGMLGAFFETERLLYFAGLGAGWLRIFLAELITLPVLCFISIWQRYEVHRYWAELKRIGDTERLRSPIRMTLHFLLLLLYPLVFPYALLPVFMVMTVLGIATVFTQTFGIVGITLFAVFLIIFLLCLPLMRRRRARKKFMRRLAAAAEENGYILDTYVASETDSTRRPQFSLTKDGRTFYVRILETLHMKTPLCFTSESTGYFLHRLGTKKHHVSLHHNFEYGFEADGPDKLLVILRYPREVRATDGNASRPLSGGDWMWGYTVFEPDTLVGYVDRKCLGRTKGLYE